jgi:hypothetical protein
MIAEQLKAILAHIPGDTPIRFTIEGVEGHATSATINHEPFHFAVERGVLADVTEPEVSDVTIEVEYGP